MLLDLLDQEVCSLLNATLQGDGIGAGGHVTQTRLDHGVGQHGGSRGAVTGGVVGFGGSLTNQGHTGVFDVVFQFNFFGDGDAVIDDLGGAKLLFQHHVAALWSEGDCHRLGQDVDTPFESPTGVLVIDDAFSHGKPCRDGFKS